MENVIKALKGYRDEVDLKERFKFEFDRSASIFSQNEVQQLNADSNLFYQNVRLKSILHNKYKNTSEQSLIDFWIINGWGGIRGFKSNERNIKKIDVFKNQLYKRKLSVDCFQTISSLSKIASFMDPDNWVIYDSRVIDRLQVFRLFFIRKIKIVNKALILEKTY